MHYGKVAMRIYRVVVFICGDTLKDMEWGSSRRILALLVWLFPRDVKRYCPGERRTSSFSSFWK